MLTDSFFVTFCNQHLSCLYSAFLSTCMPLYLSFFQWSTRTKSSWWCVWLFHVYLFSQTPCIPPLWLQLREPLLESFKSLLICRKPQHSIYITRQPQKWQQEFLPGPVRFISSCSKSIFDDPTNQVLETPASPRSPLLQRS